MGTHRSRQQKNWSDRTLDFTPTTMKTNCCYFDPSVRGTLGRMRRVAVWRLVEHATKAFCTRRTRFSHDEEVAWYVGERHGDKAIDDEDACQICRTMSF